MGLGSLGELNKNLLCDTRQVDSPLWALVGLSSYVKGSPETWLVLSMQLAELSYQTV